MTSPSSGRVPALLPGRDVGVDLARGLAILAMLVAHVKTWWPVESPSALALLRQVNNLASPLFCLVMGLAAGLVLTRRPEGVRPTPFVARNVVRGVALVAIGLLLAELPTNIAIVLQALGVVLIVGAPLALTPAPVVGVLAVLAYVLGPEVNAWARSHLVGAPTSGPVGGVLEWTLLSPSYRLTNLLPLFLLGVLLARRGLRTRDLQVAGILAGLGLAGLLLHLRGRPITPSGSHLDNLSDLCLATTVAAGALLLARTPALSRVTSALGPVVALGAVALSAYVLHVLLVAAFFAVAGEPALYGLWPLVTAVVVGGTVVVGAVWARHLGRGPVERLLALATDRLG